MRSPSASQLEQLRENLSAVRRRIAVACQRAGRSAAEVRIVAVTKYASLDVVRDLVALGHVDLGENRPQQLIKRAELLKNPKETDSGQRSATRPCDGRASTLDNQPSIIHWHLIGQLQRNKVRGVLPYVAMIHSVDSLRLLERIGHSAGELGLRPRVLLQVNVSGEASKSGFQPEVLQCEWSQLVHVDNVEIDGVMTMAPETDDESVLRSTFRGLRRLRDQLRERPPILELRELSMGMSNDFEIAVEEGATLVRLGSVVFQGLNERMKDEG